MGWGIIIKDVELRRVTIEGLESSLEDREDTIRMYREKLMMLASQTPMETMKVNGDEIPWVDWIHQEISEMLAEYETAVWERNLIQQAISFPEDATAW